MADKTKKGDDVAVASKTDRVSKTTLLQDVTSDSIDEMAKEVADYSAEWVWQSASPETKERLKSNVRKIGWLRFARFIVHPLLGIIHPMLGNAASEAVSDFAKNLQQHAEGKKGEVVRTDNKPEKVDKVATRQVNTIVEIILATDELDPAEQQDFEEWYFSDPKHRDGFNQLVRDADKDRIKSLAVRPKAELEKIIDQLQVQPPLTFIELRKQIAVNATLTALVTTFLGHINAKGNNRTREFWSAVEQHSFQSVGEFETMMSLPAEDILGILNMPTETIKQLIDKASAAIDQTLGREQTATGTIETSAVKWSSDFLARAKKAAGIALATAELRRQIAANATLAALVSAFLGRINVSGDRSQEFWSAVERRAFKTVEEFETMMSLSDDKIFDFLKLRK